MFFCALTLGACGGEAGPDLLDEPPLISAAEPPTTRERVVRMASQAESVLVRLDGSGSAQADGRALTFRWRQAEGPRVVLSDAASATPFFRTRIPGVYRFELVVSDGEQDSAPATMSVRVALPNFPPEAIVPPVIDTTAGKSIVIDGSRSRDLNSDHLTYQWQQRSGPPLQIDPEKETGPRLTLRELAAGMFEIELIVSDGVAHSKPALCRVRVMPAPQAPVAKAGADQEIILHVPPEFTAVDAPAAAPRAVARPEVVATVGEPVTLDGAQSYSPAGKPLRHYWQQREGDFIRDFAIPDGDLSKIRFTPKAPGVLTFALTVNDGELDSVPQLVTVHVVIGNAPPVAVAEAPAMGVVGRPVSLDGSKSYDRENMPLTYIWRSAAGPRVTAVGFSSPETPARPVFIPQMAGTYVFELIVSDGQKESEPARVTITVREDNLPPSIRILSVRPPAPGEPFILTAEGLDPEGMPLRYEWTQVSGPEKLLTVPARQQSLTLTAPREGSYVFQARCHDGKASSPPATLAVTVTRNIELE